MSLYHGCLQDSAVWQLPSQERYGIAIISIDGEAYNFYAVCRTFINMFTNKYFNIISGDHIQ